MDYHLHSDGRDLGVFSVEELQRRRAAGELSGKEYVWREGMPEWQSLDSVLPAPLLPSQVGSPKRKNAVLLWTGITGVLIIAAVAVAIFGRREFIRRGIAQRGMPDGIEVSSKKVTWDRKTATEADAEKRGRQFRIRQWVEGYKANGDHAAACDTEASALIQDWIEAYFGEAATNREDVALRCDQLAAMAGCDDPLVLTVTGLNAIELHEKNRRLERAVTAFDQSRHKAYPKFSAAVTLIETTTETNRVNQLFNFALRSLRQSFQDGSFHPEDQPEIAEILINTWGYNFFYRIREMVYPIPRSHGKDFEWLALVLEGEYHVMEAWKARGGGYANTVTKQGWADFGKHLELAKKSFTQAWQIRPDLPLAPCRMIYVALGQSSAEEMRMWFDHTLAAQIDYPRAWKDMRWGLRPRWHGSLEAMLALGKTALNTGRFDTDVPRKFFDVVMDIAAELDVPFGEHIYDRPDIWPELKRMYEGYIAAKSEEKSRAGWRSTYAAVAYLAGHYDVAREQLEAIEWQPWENNFSGWGADLSLMPLEVAARTGPAESKVTSAEQAYRHGDVASALRRYQELLAAGDSDMRTTKLAKARIAALELEKKLAAGEWIDLFPTATNDPAWEISFGEVRRLPEGGLEVSSKKQGHMLFSRARVGLDFEVRGEFEALKTSNGDFQAGLVMGLPDFSTTDWYAFRMKRNGDEGQLVSFSKGWSKTQVAKPLSLNKRNTFQFTFHEGLVNASVNDRTVLQNAKLRGTLVANKSEFLVGLGAFNDMNETVVRYDRVQLRKVAAAGGASKGGN
ncbi:MAG TPA: DUF4339 domain-containing protein [Verrucomicrobiae bacterium]|nr:DUF4339 domain-containing protein [Verrucomicrobiae bacterium]